MSTKYVYLAGPITGLSFGNATDWREEAADQFREWSGNIVALSPLRAKNYLAGEIEIAGSYPTIALSCDKGIVTRDRFDVRRSDVILMNLLGTERVTIGTMVELGWADAFGKPVVLVMEPENIHNHPFLRELAGFTVPTLDEGVDLVLAILSED